MPVWSAARHEEIKRIVLTLSGAAINAGIPILAASQFNRGAVGGPDELELHKLAEGSDIEKAAELVLGAWNGDKSKDADRDKAPPGTMYVKALKLRSGQPYAGLLSFNGGTGRIENYIKKV
jgi:replicative DNA helicase